MSKIEEEKGRFGVSYRGTLYPGFETFSEADDFIDTKTGWREGGAVAVPIIAPPKKNPPSVYRDRTGLLKEMRKLNSRLERRALGARKIKIEHLQQVIPPIEDVVALRKSITLLSDLYFAIEPLRVLTTGRK